MSNPLVNPKTQIKRALDPEVLVDQRGQKDAEDGTWQWRWSTGPLSSGSTHNCREPRATLSLPQENLSSREHFEVYRHPGFLTGFFLSAYFTRNVAPIAENNLPSLLGKDVYWLPMRNLVPHWTWRIEMPESPPCHPSQSLSLYGKKGEMNECIIEEERHLILHEHCMYIENNAGLSGTGCEVQRSLRETMSENWKGILKDQEELANLRRDEGTVHLIPPLLSLFKPSPDPHSQTCPIRCLLIHAERWPF